MATHKWQDLMDAKRERMGPEKWAEFERKVKEELERIQKEDSDGISR